MNTREIKLNIAGAHFWLPAVHDGMAKPGPVAGGKAKLEYAGLHASWTATRLFAAFATMGASLMLGRKQKGSATLVVTYGNGTVRTRRVHTRELEAATRYAALFNGYAFELSPQGMSWPFAA